MKEGPIYSNNSNDNNNNSRKIKNIKNSEFNWLGYCTSCNVECCHNMDSSIPDNACARQGTENFYDFKNTYILNGQSENKPETGESYDNRPLECRLFPFDIMDLDGKLVWVKKNQCHVTPSLNYEKFIDFFERQFSKKLPLDHIKQYVEQTKVTKPEKYEANNLVVIREVNWSSQ